MNVWDDFVPAEDRALAADAGYGRPAGFGKRPVILVIDVSVAFCGDRPEPIEESIKRWRNSCGEIAWEAAYRTADLLKVARERRIPIVYTTGLEATPDGFGSRRGIEKNSRRGEDRDVDRSRGNEIIEPIAPQPQDLVLAKPKISAFFGTHLTSWLAELRADSIIAMGTASSGCVRGSVLDAFQYGYRVAVVEDCTFDRIASSHKVSLFDMHLKYADIVTSTAVCEYLNALPVGLFDAEKPSLALEAAT